MGPNKHRQVEEILQAGGAVNFESPNGVRLCTNHDPAHDVFIFALTVPRVVMAELERTPDGGRAHAKRTMALLFAVADEYAHPQRKGAKA